MGVSQSVQNILINKLNPLQLDVLRMNKVTYVDVVNFLEILNSIMLDVSESEPSVISFIIVNPQVQGTVIWKLMLRICCLKTLKATGKIQSKRILKLHQFIHLYDDMVYQVSSLDLPRLSSQLFSGNGDTASSSSDFLMTSSSSSAAAGQTIPNECPICWERPPDVVLACTHAYCQVCIKQWNRDCPLCRGRSDIDADSWQCVDVNEATTAAEEQTQMASQRNRVLIGLADKAGEPMP